MLESDAENAHRNPPTQHASQQDKPPEAATFDVLPLVLPLIQSRLRFVAHGFFLAPATIGGLTAVIGDSTGWISNTATNIPVITMAVYQTLGRKAILSAFGKAMNWVAQRTIPLMKHCFHEPQESAAPGPMAGWRDGHGGSRDAVCAGAIIHSPLRFESGHTA